MRPQPLAGRDRLIVALDFPDRRSAVPMMERLRGHVGMFKVGKQLFVAEGPAIVREIVGAGERVFLDLKFHDIPNTVAGAVASAVSLGVSLINVHAAGGSAMMRAAAEAAKSSETRILAVTVLTSLEAPDLAAIGFSEQAEQLAVRLTRLALDSGLHGVVAPATEAPRLRRELGSNFLIVTPGIRPAGAHWQDQARVSGPREAILAGADYIVVGRPITEAPDPAAAARGIVEMLE